MGGTRGKRFLLALVVAASAAVAPALPAAAAPAHHPQGGDYLALGDSLAFGYRPPAVTPRAEYLDPSNFSSYADDAGTDLGLRLTNASCPGETAASMIDASAPSFGCESDPDGSPGYRAAFPLHVSYSGAQLAYAVDYLRSHPQTRLVTIDIGANDLFLCKVTTPDHCTGPELLATLSKVSHHVATIVATLRQQAHYADDLVLVSYYSLDYRDPRDLAEVLALNAALVTPSGRYGLKIADGFGAFLRAAAVAGGDTCAAGLLVKLPDGTCDVHPSGYGHHVLARAVEAAVRSRVGSG